ncbi:MAG: 1,4-dihydroxy-2-naphthoate octaprenyltransferase [Planctomycetota bacterium]|jgi:1,4-dihydroxy-2-naphthoate octaprenyltransferase
MHAISIWIQATRPKTLAAGAVPVAVGTLLAVPPGQVAWGPALGCLAGALLLQIGCNFANEVGDFRRGADTPDRIGPTRAVAAGLIKPRAMVAATGLVLGLATVVGLLLALHAGWPVLAIGAVSIVAALAYTLGPYPLAYRGLGEPFVLLFFGWVATLGSAWVQLAPVVEQVRPLLEGAAQVQSLLDRVLGREPPPPDRLAAIAHTLPWLLTATAIGLQATVLITVNNLRDIATDGPAGKRTLAVRLGDRGTRVLVALLALGAAGCWSGAAVRDLPEPARVFGLGEPGWAPAVVAGLGGIVITGLALAVRGAALNRVLALGGASLLATGIAACVSLWR